MNKSTRKKTTARKGTTPASKDPDTKVNNTQASPPVKNQNEDSEQIERAVYDGMQDLRTKKPQ